MINVMLIDDHNIVRMGLRMAFQLTPDINVLCEAENPKQALAKLKIEKPDIILLDIRMPESTGIELLKRLRVDYPSIKVIMLTMSDTEEDIYQALHLGASGYMMKSAQPDAIIEAIRLVQSGKTVFPKNILQQLERRENQQGLSSRQMEVLTLMAKGLSNKEISDTTRLSEKTIRFYNTIIFDKLSATNRTEAVKIAIHRGIIKLA
ncbi:MAG: response regulator transcription factor [bacterium]